MSQQKADICLYTIALRTYVLSHFSHVQLCATLWTVAPQASLSMGFSRQECWSGLPFPSPGDLPDPGIEPTSLLSYTLAGRFFTTSTSWEAPHYRPTGTQIHFLFTSNRIPIFKDTSTTMSDS